MPDKGKIYSFNEGNYGSWAPHLQEYINSLKDASKWDGKPYSSRSACRAAVNTSAVLVLRCREAGVGVFPSWKAEVLRTWLLD